MACLPVRLRAAVAPDCPLCSGPARCAPASPCRWRCPPSASRCGRGTAGPPGGLWRARRVGGRWWRAGLRASPASSPATAAEWRWRSARGATDSTGGRARQPRRHPRPPPPTGDSRRRSASPGRWRHRWASPRRRRGGRATRACWRPRRASPRPGAASGGGGAGWGRGAPPASGSPGSRSVRVAATAVAGCRRRRRGAAPAAAAARGKLPRRPPSGSAAGLRSRECGRRTGDARNACSRRRCRATRSVRLVRQVAPAVVRCRRQSVTRRRRADSRRVRSRRCPRSRRRRAARRVAPPGGRRAWAARGASPPVWPGGSGGAWPCRPAWRWPPSASPPGGAWCWASRTAAARRPSSPQTDARPARTRLAAGRRPPIGCPPPANRLRAARRTRRGRCRSGRRGSRYAPPSTRFPVPSRQPPRRPYAAAAPPGGGACNRESRVAVSPSAVSWGWSAMTSDPGTKRTFPVILYQSTRY